MNIKDGHTPDLENLIASQILPIRPGRHHTRNVKSQPYVSKTDLCNDIKCLMINENKIWYKVINIIHLII